MATTIRSLPTGRIDSRSASTWRTSPAIRRDYPFGGVGEVSRRMASPIPLRKGVRGGGQSLSDLIYPFIVQREVELQHVHMRLADDAQQPAA